MDLTLAIIYGLNIVVGLLNRNWCSAMGWACAGLMLARVHFG